MFFALATIALTTFVGLGNATPLSSVSSSVQPTSQKVTTAAHFPVHDLGSVSAHPNVTLSSAGAHADATDQVFPATLLLCPSTGCPSCFTFDLSTLPVDECLVDLSSTFNSVAISQPSNEGLPFAVLVGPPGCGSFVQIPVVNECFNINGGPFQDFAVVE